MANNDAQGDEPASKAKEKTPFERAKALVALKNFAVYRGYSIPDTLITGINEVEKEFEKPTPPDEKTISKLDILAVQLSEITYPINLCNVLEIDICKGVTRFAIWLLAFGILASLFSGYLIWSIKKDSGPLVSIAPPALALCLGLIGAIVYVLLPNGKLNAFAGVDAATIANDLARVGIGAILGFVLFIVANGLATDPNAKGLKAPELILPFMGGYSIALVMGILAKAIAAISLTFGIDEKSIRSSLQR